MGDSGGPAMDEQIIAERLLEEQIPGEEAVVGDVIDEKILDDPIIEEEQEVFDIDEEATAKAVGYFFGDDKFKKPRYETDLELEDAKLFGELSIKRNLLADAVSEQKILVVGAGGIGCELLKDLVLIGFKDIEVIDLDTIDVSNLNRQFLFRRHHVSKPKAIIARRSALEFNPDVKIKAYHDSIFSKKFGVTYFEQFSLVLNALDNRAARNHVNRLCLAANVPLIETGTSGYHGQVEAIIKGMTQCYECEPKPAQKTYPGCTIRNTPSEPVHCIVWAKHLFNQLFGEEDADNEVSPDASDPELTVQETKETEGNDPNLVSVKTAAEADAEVKVSVDAAVDVDVEPQAKSKKERAAIEPAKDAQASKEKNNKKEVNILDIQSPDSPDEILAVVKLPSHSRAESPKLKRVILGNRDERAPFVIRTGSEDDEEEDYYDDDSEFDGYMPARDLLELAAQSVTVTKEELEKMEKGLAAAYGPEYDGLPAKPIPWALNEIELGDKDKAKPVKNDGNVKRTSTREWARETGYSPELLHRKFFVDDIEYLLSMKTLWKTRRPPTPSHLHVSRLPKDVDAEFTGLDRTMKVWTWPMCTKVFAESLKTLAERFTALIGGDYLTWDKDDDVALDFVTACANIRSYIFAIPVKSRFDVKAIAGNIIPAIATTNAIVSGVAIFHSLHIIEHKLERVTTVHLRKYPNANGELFLPEKSLIPPNPSCCVCASTSEVMVQLDTENVTVAEFEQGVLKEGLNMIAPDVVLPSNAQIVISSEEGETTANNEKYLSELGITEGTILHADDFEQDFEVRIIIRHKPRTSRDEAMCVFMGERKHIAERYRVPKGRWVITDVEGSEDDPPAGCSKDAENNKNDTDMDTEPTTNGKSTASTPSTPTTTKHKLEDEPDLLPPKKMKSFLSGARQ